VCSKSAYFKGYEEISKRFGKLIGVDPWLVYPISDRYEAADEDTPATREVLAAHIDAALAKVKRKYNEYGIKEKAFIVIKADHAGTPLETLSVRDAAGAKHVPPTLDLVLQEGVLTNERINDSVAEPVVYMMDRYVVGGFYRVHPERGADQDLCAPGASYVPLAFDNSMQLPQPGVRPGASAPNRFYMYGVLGRLAMLAGSYELEATDPDAEQYD
jgi:glutamate--cysteine ligase